MSEADFPRGRLDESLQPLDLSPENSWSRRLGDVPTAELLHTRAANAAAPFVMCSKLYQSRRRQRTRRGGTL